MKRLITTDPAFPAAFRALVADGRDTTSRVDGPVTAIIADIRARGDDALIDYTARFDRLDLTPATLRVAPDDLVEAARGQGLSPGQVLRRLRLPLGAGVMLGALRLAAVQAIGLATLAALVGGGGLGTVVFQGIGQLASDLILLGVLPILALSLAADAGLALLARLAPGERTA